MQAQNHFIAREGCSRSKTRLLILGFLCETEKLARRWSFVLAQNALGATPRRLGSTTMGAPSATSIELLRSRGALDRPCRIADNKLLTSRN
jgi:hypothetical protein